MKERVWKWRQLVFKNRTSTGYTFIFFRSIDRRKNADHAVVIFANLNKLVCTYYKESKFNSRNRNLMCGQALNFFFVLTVQNIFFRKKAHKIFSNQYNFSEKKGMWKQCSEFLDPIPSLLFMFRFSNSTEVKYRVTPNFRSNCIPLKYLMSRDNLWSELLHFCLF